MPVPLLQHIKRFVALSPEDEAIISQHVSMRKVKSREFLLEAGQVCRANYFVVNGCFRMYSRKDDGTEQIVQFGIDNWWITDHTSLEQQAPSMFCIQAVEPGEIVVLERRVQEALFERVPLLDRYFRKVLQRAYAASVMRFHYIFSESGEERYQHFNSAFPEFVQRVPQYMLASYLGFTPEFLSRIRAKKG